VLFILGAVYFLLAERGIVKLSNPKRQLEFNERMKNKTWKYLFITLAYVVIIFSVYLMIKNLYK
jgi:hypothetical protein